MDSASDIQDYFEYVIKNHNVLLGPRTESLTVNPPIRIYVNKIENRITFEIKSGFYLLTLLTLETMKLLGSIQNKTTKDKSGKNVPHVEITQVILVHLNLDNSRSQQISRNSCMPLFQINNLGNC